MPQKSSNFPSVELKFKRSLIAVLCSLSVSAMAAEDKNDESEIDEIVVTGRQQALQNAAELKRNAESSIDSIVADDAGMLPDASITEVLQRISGVSIVRFASLGNPDAFSAEGSGVQVRGLSGVASRLNGREVFSANSGRGLSWSDVTPELMAGVDVYKSATADLIEGGTGGTIDLRTKMPFDSEGFQASLTSSATYADLSEELTPSGSFLVSNRWDTSIGEFGALLDLSASEYKQRADFIRMEPFYATAISDGNGGYEDKFIPGGYDYGTTSYERNRKGGYLGLQWAPNDDLTISQTVFYSEYDDQSASSGLFVVSENLTVDPSVSQFDKNDALIKTSNIFLRNNATFLANANQTISAGGNTGVSAGTSETLDISTSFKWNASERWSFKGALQMVDSAATRSNYDVFPGVPFPGTFELDLSGKLPRVQLSQSGMQAFSDPARYNWQATMDHVEDNDGDLRAGNIDASYVISESGFFRSAQFGARYSERTEIDNNSGYNWTALGRGWNGSPQETFAQAEPGDVESRSFDNFFRGQTNLPANTLMPSQAMAERRDVVLDHTNYGGLPVQPIGFNPNGVDRLNQETDNTAVYALVRFADDQDTGMRLNGNVGGAFCTYQKL